MTVQTQDTGKAVSSVIAQSWHRCSKFMQRETGKRRTGPGLTFDSICRRKTALLTIGGRRWKTQGVYGRPPLRAVYS